MAAAYIVTLPLTEGGKSLRDGVNSVVVYAEDTSQAKEAAAALFNGDAAWSSATVTAIAAGDYTGWTVRVRLSDPDKAVTASDYTMVDVSVTGDATNNTIDEVAALLVTALNATSAIAGAAYNATTQVLTVAETTDGLGDHVLRVDFTHPSFEQPIASLVGTIVDEGSAGAAVTVTLKADAVVPPKLYGKGVQK